MKASQLFALMVAIYLAPKLKPKVTILAAALCLLASMGFFVWELL